MAEVSAPPGGVKAETSLIFLCVVHHQLLKCCWHQSVLFLRTLWLMGLRWASATNMGKLLWTKPNLICVNSSEVSRPPHCHLPHSNRFKCIFDCLYEQSSHYNLSLHHTDKAEKMGQNLTKIPFKDTFWKGTTRTRPRESHKRIKQFISWPVSISWFSRRDEREKCSVLVSQPILMWCLKFPLPVLC